MRTSSRLNAAGVKSTRETGRHGDGNGLYLVVTRSGGKHWVSRVMIQGRRRDVGLGSFRLVSLAEARDANQQLRRDARAGGDPLGDRYKSKAPILTFQEACETVFEHWRTSFRSSKHSAQWIGSLRTYAYPTLATMDVATIEPRHIYAVLWNLWSTKPETARRIKQRLVKVFDWCKAQGHIQGDNAASTVDAALGPRRQSTKHLGAIPHAEMPTFAKTLVESSVTEATRAGLLLTALSALRTSEVRLARWDEIDWDNCLWTIPAERQLKKKKPEPHAVPLSPAAMIILERLKLLAGDSPWLLPGRDGRKPICDTTMLVALKSLLPKVTVHGFRATFRTWVEDEVEGMGEAAEEALAHSKGNKVQAAYRRGKLLTKRRLLMNKWAEFVFSSTPDYLSSDRHTYHSQHSLG
ncbi:MAG: integrase arm-type DNA-binding domain-containing protein [Hyphomicrobiaceae bacterium]